MAMEDLIKTVKPNYSIQVLINHVATLNISQLFRQLSLVEIYQKKSSKRFPSVKKRAIFIQVTKRGEIQNYFE